MAVADVCERPTDITEESLRQPQISFGFRKF